ncbi:MAG: phosphogluconate dehydrogenase (NAD(+)-dependent, decarboxylating) [Bacteroidota bacterium]
MDIAIVGLGRMGLNIALRLLRDGHRVVVHNRSPEPVAVAVEAGAEAAETMEDVARLLDGPRVVWLMLPAGDITDQHVDEALGVLEAGDLIVEGSNGKWSDAIDQDARARQRGVGFVDVGVSGGVWGLENGYSLMAGGTDANIALVEPAFKTLAPTPDTGWGHVGPVGSGHFVKMVHNGVEYGLMQAFAEGFAILDAQRQWGDHEHTLDLGQVAAVWQTGSVVQSWLLDLIAEVFEARPDLGGIAPYVPDSGEGRWTVDAAVDLRVPAPVIAASLFARFDSRDETRVADRVLSAMRGQFGGHPVKGDPGPNGEYTDQIADDGTIDVVPGGVQTEGASTRPI